MGKPAEPGDTPPAEPPRPKSHNGPFSRFITIDGDTLLLCEWAKLYGLSKNLILNRILRGWSEERAVTTPAAKHVRKNGKEKR